MKPLVETTELSARLKAMWPDDLLDWTPTDREYALVTLELMQQFAAMFPENRPYKDKVNECEEIANRGVVLVRDWEYDNGYDVNHALGRVYLTRHHGIDENHTINIGIGESKTYLWDRQTGEVWIANPENDIIYNVEM